MKRDPAGDNVGLSKHPAPRRSHGMLYAGLDLSRKRLDVHVLREDGTTALVTAISPDGDAMRSLVRRVAAEGEPVRATIESMNGARFIHDSLEFAGWDVLIADAQRVRGPVSYTHLTLPTILR